MEEEKEGQVGWQQRCQGRLYYQQRCQGGRLAGRANKRAPPPPTSSDNSTLFPPRQNVLWNVENILYFYITLLHNAQVPLISFSSTLLPLRSDRVPLHCIALQGSLQEIPLYLCIELLLLTLSQSTFFFSLAIHCRSVWCAYGNMANGFYPGRENNVTGKSLFSCTCKFASNIILL